jgi:Fic family protein
VIRGPSGRYALADRGELVRAFVPAPLPPDPPIDLTPELQQRSERAQLACGRLDGIRSVLPDPFFFLYASVRREALLSSQIEGTQSSLSDLLLFELERDPVAGGDDVLEVSNYVAAIAHGTARIDGGFPLANRLIRETHGILLRSGRGAEKSPGQFRRTQNWIGGTRPGNARFVPPPPDEVEACMASLEQFINGDSPNRLIKAALAHAQFETIHPFLDGNGRVGRLLVALMLHNDNVLRQPVLFLSLFLKQHRDEYYRLLDLVRREGDWEAWLSFFLEGIESAAESAVDTVNRLLALFNADEARLRDSDRVRASAIRALAELRKLPVATVTEIATRIGVTFPTAGGALEALQALGIVKEITGRRRDRIFAYQAYLDILSEGSEPL